LGLEDDEVPVPTWMDESLARRQHLRTNLGAAEATQAIAVIGIAPEKARGVLRELRASGRVPLFRLSPVPRRRIPHPEAEPLSRLWLGAQTVPTAPSWSR
jgi:hypothetical protein